MNPGVQMYELAERLWPIGRSLSGQGVRETLGILHEQLPSLEINGFATGDIYSDWTIPNEWNVQRAFIIDPNGRKICDYSTNNLHLVGYSKATEKILSRHELENHLYSLPDQPTAIPYVTSYYREDWGFCISQEDRDNLPDGEYQVTIESSLEPGELNYGEILISGKSEKEIFFSTYICHPSMANNELSGPVLATELARYLSKIKPFYSYRFLFIPETIGSIAYITKHFKELKSRMLAGYVLTCVGDDKNFSYLPSRSGMTVADRIALKVLQEKNIGFRKYSWKDRGSDERQYCAPGVDLPVCSVMRTKYGDYPEYHTSLDRLGSVVTVEGLQGSFDYFQALITVFEELRFPKIKTLGEPQLGKRNLYPNTSMKGVYLEVQEMMDVISYLDGTLTFHEIADVAGVSLETVEEVCKKLEKEGLVAL